jgi:hypothetical protein
MSTPQEQQTKLSELQSRIVEIDRMIQNLDNDFADCANDFPSSTSLRRASGIEQRITDLRREKMLALAATAKLEQTQKAAMAEAAQAVERAQASKARTIAEQLMQLHESIDQQLRVLAESCLQRQNLLSALGRSAEAYLAVATRLSQRAPLTRAACYHGLHKFIQLEAVSPQGMIALSDANSLLSGIGREHGNGQPTRARLGN